MPTAVMTESSEKTMSSSTIWAMTPRRTTPSPSAASALVIVDLELLEDLVGRLADQEQAAAEQDQIAPAEVVSEQAEQGGRQSHHPRDREQQPEQPHPEREHEAERRASGCCWPRQLRRHDREEDDVVDAKHDLQRGEGRQRDPAVGVQKGAQVGHRGGAFVARTAVTACHVPTIAPLSGGSIAILLPCSGRGATAITTDA